MTLVAIMDWWSRYVLSWEVSVTLDASFCVEALERALAPGRAPGIFNSDQGSQFTSEAFTGVLRAGGIRISMDGRGRCYDNIFVERLWRSVKHEHVYLHDPQTVAEATMGLGRYGSESMKQASQRGRLKMLAMQPRRVPSAPYSGLPS